MADLCPRCSVVKSAGMSEVEGPCHGTLLFSLEAEITPVGHGASNVKIRSSFSQKVEGQAPAVRADLSWKKPPIAVIVPPARLVP